MAPLWYMDEAEVVHFRCAGITSNERMEAALLVDSFIQWSLTSSNGMVSGMATVSAADDSLDGAVRFIETKDSLQISTIRGRYTILYDEALSPTKVTVEYDEFTVAFNLAGDVLAPESWAFVSPELESRKDSLFEYLLKEIHHLPIKCK